MCHFLPVYHLGIAFLGRVEGQKYNIISLLLHGLDLTKRDIFFFAAVKIIKMIRNNSKIVDKFECLSY